MIGLAVIAGVALYIGICWLIVRALKQRWAKALAVLTAIAIPFWDFPIGYLAFYEHCTQEGGLRVIKRTAPIQAVMADQSTGYTPKQLIAEGFSTVEIASSNGHITRFTEPGLTRVVRPEEAQSNVQISSVRNQLLRWNVLRNDTIATDIHSKEILATHSEFRWSGSWWQARTAPLLAATYMCHTHGGHIVLAALRQGLQ